MTRIALDAMGGDNAPEEIVKGCLKALTLEQDVCVTLVGREEAIGRCLAGKEYDHERLKVVNATEVIETGDSPVASIRQKKDSSIVVGLRMVRSGEQDAFVSAGSSGALLVGFWIFAAVGNKKEAEE